VIPPFRQLQRLYDSFLLAGRSMADLSTSLPSAIAELRRSRDSNNQELARVIAEAVKPAQKDVDIYDRQELRLLLDRSSIVDRTVIESGTWEPEQTTFLMGLMERFIGRQNIAFLDIGAYWGLYSLLAVRAGVERVYAFEPDLHNFAQLQAQIFLNNASGIVRPINKAVTSSSGTLRTWDSRGHPSGNRAGVGIVDKSFSRPTNEIEAVSIDEFLPLEDWTIGIKLDVESHEPEALKGMVKTFAKNRVIIQVEVFEAHEGRTVPVIESLELREINRIWPDRYYTNMTPEELGN
jgi:FkbM family methyltransferase